MAILKLERFSKILGSQKVVRLVIPDQICTGKVTVLWLFHGLGDDGSCWLRKTRLEAFLAEKQIIAIIPDMGRSFYQNMADGQLYQDYLLNELMPQLQKLLPLSLAPKHNYLAGNSMGGFGALQFAFKYPQKFRTVFALSPVVAFNAIKPFMPDLNSVFGSKLPENYLQNLILAAGSHKLQQLECHLLIGNQDFMLKENKIFATFLEQQKFCNFDFKISVGKHDWIFWDTAIEKVITQIIDLENRK